jgi:hypothetical protein
MMYDPDLQPGAPTLLAALTYATEHPEHHQQDTWLLRVTEPTDNWCGTAGCLAGIIVLLHGWKPVFSGLGETSRISKNGVAISQVRDVATELARLDDANAGHLFDADYSLPELWRLAAEVYPDQITVPEHLPEPQEAS